MDDYTLIYAPKLKFLKELILGLQYKNYSTQTTSSPSMIKIGELLGMFLHQTFTNYIDQISKSGCNWYQIHAKIEKKEKEEGGAERERENYIFRV